ncbi:MAG TPA: type II toxin-antitoxin system VapC family toxin [Pseudolabrys sp.]|nr:type II toxin-antitoxin system VapC family toxin [Pseudolabrys sp.]
MIVIDASVLLELLLRTPSAEAVERRLFGGPQESVHAPHLVDVEVTQVLRRYSASGEIDEERGRAALADLADFPIRRYPHDLLLMRVWELRNNFTAYDGVYVALAEALAAPLLTRDRRLAAAARRHASVELM